MKSGHKRNKSSGSQSSFEQKMEGSNNAAPEGNPLLERAFQGKITPDEYRTVVRNYIRDENKKTTGNSFRAGLGLVSISTHSIDFNAELSNSLLPVLDFEEKSKFSARAVIKLTNASKQKVFFDISWFNNPKFGLEVTPTSAEIKANSSIEATLDIRVFCTTKVYQMLDIHLTKTKKKGILGKKTEEDIGHLFLMIKLQSEASSSIDFDEIKKEELIGEGAYGKVFRGFYREDEVAIKELNLEQYVDEELVLVRREIGNMSKLKSKFIVQYIGATLVRSQPLCVVMEYIKNGTLTKFLETRPFSNAFKTKLSLDVARGMAVLHSNNVGHRDLKSDNVLVFTHNEDAPLNLKITDFGQSKAQVNREKESNYANYETFNVAAKKQEIRSSKGVGTLIYQAPEILEGSSTFNDQSIDVFSFGVLLWQIFTQREPYSMEPYTNWNGRQIADFVKSGNRLAIPKETPREITALITACWDQDPSNRPQFSQTIVPSLTQIYEKLAKEGSNGPLPQLPLGVSSTASSFLPHQQPIGLVQNNSFTSSSAYPFNGMNSGSSKGSSGSTSPNQGVAPYIPIVGGAPEPPGNLYAIGWCGEIARDDAVKLLQKYPKGCFLVRWSSKQKCFVVSYNAPSSGVKHIDSIWLKDNQIQVLRADNSMPVYRTMEEYISTLREQEKILGEPIKIQLPQTNDDNIYDKA